MAKKTRVRRRRPLKFKITKKDAACLSATTAAIGTGLVAGRALRMVGRASYHVGLAAGRALFRLINKR